MNLAEVTWSWKMRSAKSEHLVAIERYVCVTFLLLAILLGLGHVRRRCRNIVVKYFCLGLNAIVGLLISYIFGLMQYLVVRDKLVSVWATFLVVVYAKYLDVANINDPLSNGLACLRFLHYLYYAANLLHRNNSVSFAAPLAYLLLISEVSIVSRVRSVFYVINSSQHLTPYSFLWGMNRCNNNGNRVGEGTDTLQRCQYVLNPNSIRKIRICDIWSCKDGSFLESSGDKSNQLKNISLSFSLFWLLLHKFAGYPPYETSHRQDALRFVQVGLLHCKDTLSATPDEPLDSEKTRYPFRVIEVELQFLYDFFFSIQFQSYQTGFWPRLVMQLFYQAVVSWICVALFTSYRPEEQTLIIQFQELRFDGGVLATLLMIIIITVIEVSHFYILSTSKWSKMLLLCTYMNRESWTERSLWGRCTKKAAEFVCLKSRSKPQETKMRQYSLPGCIADFAAGASRKYDYRSSLNSMGIPVNPLGRKQSDSIILSHEIMSAVIEPIRDVRDGYPLLLTNGRHALELIQDPDLTYDTKRKLVNSCSQVESDITRVILTWHIATSLCEINPELTQTHRESADFQVATSLSKYCAYLAAFAPKLLPGHSAITDRTCTMALLDGKKLHDKGVITRFDHLYEDLVNTKWDGAGRITDNILLQGAVLARILDKEITTPATRWKVVANVWAERILYLAPSLNNEWAHLDCLAQGGPEFITLLWALLFHAGIVDRESRHSWDMEASSSTS